MSDSEFNATGAELERLKMVAELWGLTVEEAASVLLSEAMAERWGFASVPDNVIRIKK